MGDKLVKVYEAIGEEGGNKAKMRLAMKTGIPENKAAGEEDAPDVVEKFKAAFKDITGKDAPAV